MLIELARSNREFVAAIAAGGVGVIPTGAVEQHGPHLPLGMDFRLAEHFARLSGEAATASVLLAPAVPYGRSAYHRRTGATVSLTTSTFAAVAMETGRSLVSFGCRCVLFINGHGGNSAILSSLVTDLSDDLDVVAASVDYWSPAEQQIETIANRRWRIPGHAGGFETSLALALWPGEVHTPIKGSRARVEIPAPPPGFEVADASIWRQIDGYSDQPSSADAEIGSRLANVITASLASSLDGLASRCGL